MKKQFLILTAAGIVSTVISACGNEKKAANHPLESTENTQGLIGATDSSIRVEDLEKLARQVILGSYRSPESGWSHRQSRIDRWGSTGRLLYSDFTYSRSVTFELQIQPESTSELMSLYGETELGVGKCVVPFKVGIYYEIAKSQFHMKMFFPTEVDDDDCEMTGLKWRFTQQPFTLSDDSLSETYGSLMDQASDPAESSKWQLFKAASEGDIELLKLKVPSFQGSAANLRDWEGRDPAMIALLQPSAHSPAAALALLPLWTVDLVTSKGQSFASLVTGSGDNTLFVTFLDQLSASAHSAILAKAMQKVAFQCNLERATQIQTKFSSPTLASIGLASLADRPAQRLEGKPCDFSSVIESFIQAGADPKSKGYALASAIENGWETSITALLANGADVNAIRQNRESGPLGAAIGVDNLDLVEKLLNAGADPSIPQIPNNGNALTFCGRFLKPGNSLKIIQLLISRGVAINSKTKTGSTIFDLVGEYLRIQTGNFRVKKQNHSPTQFGIDSYKWLRANGAEHSTMTRPVPDWILNP